MDALARRGQELGDLNALSNILDRLGDPATLNFTFMLDDQDQGITVGGRLSDVDRPFLVANPAGRAGCDEHADGGTGFDRQGRVGGRGQRGHPQTQVAKDHQNHF